MTKIKLFIDGNEFISNRPDALLAAAEKRQEWFAPPQAKRLPLDYVAVHGHIADWWEVKTLEDLYSSMDTFHLAQQMVPAIARFNHITLAIFATFDEVREEVPDANGKRPEEIIELERNRLRGLLGDLHGDGVRVHFLSSNLEASFEWILTYTKNTLLGGDICTHLPRPEIIQQGLLSLLPGVGPKTVEPLLEQYHFELVPNSPQSLPLSEVKVGSKRFGDKRARTLMESLRWR